MKIMARQGLTKTHRSGNQRKLEPPAKSVSTMRSLLHPVLQLQQTIGNQAVARLIQTKLKIGQPGDAYEQEASRVSENVVHGTRAAVRGTTGQILQRSPAWDSDVLGVDLEPLDPTTPGQITYTENGFLHQRMSSNLSRYRGPFCQNTKLPFRCNVEFRVDYLNEPRPRPFSPPRVSVNFRFAPPRGGFDFSESDSNPRYVGQDKPLETSFGHRFDFTLDDNGPFTMTFVLDDPDTGINRTYDDHIDIEAKRPCV